MELELKPSDKENSNDGHDGQISRITVEHAIYFLIVIIAASLRFLDLDFVPLSPAEATEALATWNFWQADPIPTDFSSPLYFSTTAFLTQVLGFRDGVMRLVPAAFGLGLVILPWFLRHRLGQVGAIIASLLFALSPSLTMVSRTAGGQSAAVFFGLLCFIAWLRYQETGVNYWFYTLAVALGLGLASAPVFITLVLVFALAWLTQMIVGPYILTDEEGRRLPNLWPNRQTIRDGALILAGVLILGATAFLLMPSGIGATADIIAVWSGRILDFVSAQVWLSPFLAIGRYEIAAIILGVPAVIWATRNDSGFPIVLVYAICWTLLLILLQPGQMSNILVVSLVGYLLIGGFVGAILSRPASWYDLAVFLIVLLAGGIIFSNIVRYGRLAAFQSSQTGTYHLLLALTAFVLAIIAITMIWSWSEQNITVGVTVGLLVLLLVSMWSSAWWLGREGGNDTRELWTNVATDGDIRLMAENIREISWEITNSEKELLIKSTVDEPNLKWYLRDMEELEFVSTLPNTDFSQALLTPMTEIPPLSNEYIGTDFAFLRNDTGHILEFQQSLTWWLFQESPVPINEERLILWLRADLAGGSL